MEALHVAGLKAELSEDGLLVAGLAARLAEHGSDGWAAPVSVKAEGTS
jgi:hypothetical protein